MAKRVRLINVTQLKKSSDLVQKEASELLSSTRLAMDKQAAFMKEIGIDKKSLRNFINNGKWSAPQRQKMQQELIQFNGDLKADMSQAVAAMRKKLKEAGRLLSGKKALSKGGRKRRTGFL